MDLSAIVPGRAPCPLFQWYVTICVTWTGVGVMNSACPVGPFWTPPVFVLLKRSIAPQGCAQAKTAAAAAKRRAIQPMEHLPFRDFPGTPDFHARRQITPFASRWLGAGTREGLSAGAACRSPGS